MASATDEQITKVREIVGEPDKLLVTALITTLSTADWNRAEELITAWDAKFAPGKPGVSLRGGKEGVFYLPTEAGEDIRARMRILLGLSEFRSADITGGPATVAVPVEWRF